MDHEKGTQEQEVGAGMEDKTKDSNAVHVPSELSAWLLGKRGERSRSRFRFEVFSSHEW